MARAARRFAEPPADPSAQAIVAREDLPGGSVRVTLACGHTARRKFMRMPSQLICRECPR